MVSKKKGVVSGQNFFTSNCSIIIGKFAVRVSSGELPIIVCEAVRKKMCDPAPAVNNGLLR